MPSLPLCMVRGKMAALFSTDESPVCLSPVLYHDYESAVLGNWHSLNFCVI